MQSGCNLSKLCSTFSGVPVIFTVHWKCRVYFIMRMACTCCSMSSTSRCFASMCHACKSNPLAFHISTCLCGIPPGSLLTISFICYKVLQVSKSSLQVPPATLWQVEVRQAKAISKVSCKAISLIKACLGFSLWPWWFPRSICKWSTSQRGIKWSVWLKVSNKIRWRGNRSGGW